MAYLMITAIVSFVKKPTGRKTNNFFFKFQKPKGYKIKRLKYE